MDDALLASIRSLLATARTKTVTPKADAQLEEIDRRLAGPLRVAIAGRVKAGKSTLLNALIGEELAATDAGECTKIVTWYQQGEQPRVVLHGRSGQQRSARFNRSGGALEIDLHGIPPEDVDRVEVWWPTGRLRDLTLIDTPGIASISTDISERTLRVLTPEDDRPPVVDAIVYLLRHTHASDARFLEAFHDDELAHGSPMNAIGVLSRADEIGACRLDALDVAERIAQRYQREPRLRRLCPVIVPVAGLLGHAGVTLREPEYRPLAALATAPASQAAELLLTVDRFADRATTVPVTELERQHLLGRLGLFGVRLSVGLIRDGVVGNATELSRELVRRSGLDQLQAGLHRQFTERSRILKAHSALSAFSAVLAGGGCADPDLLRSHAEQITAGAHEFEEVRLLNRLRTDGFDLRAEQAEELDRLLGGSGHDPAARLGLNPDDAADDDVRAATLEALARWQRIAEHPLSPRGVQVAARGARRTLEGLYSSLVHAD